MERVCLRNLGFDSRHPAKKTVRYRYIRVGTFALIGFYDMFIAKSRLALTPPIVLVSTVLYISRAKHLFAP